MHFEGDNCLKGVLMVFEWLARAKLKVIYIWGRHLGWLWPICLARPLFRFHVPCFPYTGFVSGHTPLLLSLFLKSSTREKGAGIPGLHIKALLASLSGLDGDEAAVSNIYMSVR